MKKIICTLPFLFAVMPLFFTKSGVEITALASCYISFLFLLFAPALFTLKAKGVFSESNNPITKMEWKNPPSKFVAFYLTALASYSILYSLTVYLSKFGYLIPETQGLHGSWFSLNFFIVFVLSLIIPVRVGDSVFGLIKRQYLSILTGSLFVIIPLIIQLNIQS